MRLEGLGKNEKKKLNDLIGTRIRLYHGVSTIYATT
jgi:hypothetical protein